MITPTARKSPCCHSIVGQRELRPSRNLVNLTFLPQNVTVQAAVGDTILDAALDNGIDLQHECGGNCACTTCHVIIEAGVENLSPMEEVERDRLATATGWTSRSRL